MDQAIRRAQAVCRRGFESPDLPPELVALIGAAVPFDIACWGLLDPVTALPTTNFSTMAGFDQIDRVWEYELTVPDVMTLTELLGRRPAVGVLSEATAGDLRASPRYRHILGPALGVTDELRAALVVDGVGWGYLALLRATGARFGAAEAAGIARLAPLMAAALRDAALARSIRDDAQPPAVGIAIVDADGRLESATATGRELLDLIPSPPGLPLPGVVAALAMRAHRGLPRRGGAATRALVPARDGSWLHLEAEPLSGAPPSGGSGRAVVTIRVAGRGLMSPVAMRAHGLTARESEVTACVLRGESTRQIAARLHLSAWTVQDHLKSVFDKTGVRSRRELSHRLFEPPARQTVPR